jgi:hypothetical protein
MAFTYDITTPAGKVRLLCTDVDSTNPVFQDTEIAAFLTMESDSIKRAAALALETIAANQVLVLKVIELLEIKTDGAAVARELRLRAGLLRDQAAAEIDADDVAFDIAEQVFDPFSYRERVYNEALRGNA